MLRMFCRQLRIAFAVAVCAAALSACRQAPEAPPIDPPTAGLAGTRATLRAGLTVINERFIEPITAEAIAIAALRGLADIDQQVIVGLVAGTVVLSVAGQKVAVWDTPRARDIDGWTQLVLQAWQTARTRSPLLASAAAEDVLRAMFLGVLAPQDPFASYQGAAQARQGRERRIGQRGVGASIRLKDGMPVVVELIGQGWAERAGLRVGDILVDVDGQSLQGMNESAIAAQLRGDGSVGHAVLNVRRGTGNVLRLVIPRAPVTANTAVFRYEDGVLYVSIRYFNQGTADSVAGAMAALSGQRAHLRGVVLDLRGNPGGLLSQAVRVAQLFVDRGLILSTRGRHPESIQVYQAEGAMARSDLPLVVLIDARTASAAELLAASLRDRGRAILVGSTSLGKALVQTIVPLPDGSELGFTWSRALPPSGQVMQGTGVRPLICSNGLFVADPDLIDALLTTTLGETADRTACNSERRTEAVDVQIALRLIDDPSIYAAARRKDRVLAEMPAARLPGNR